MADGLWSPHSRMAAFASDETFPTIDEAYPTSHKSKSTEARDAVMHTVELVEAILLHLPLRDIIVAAYTREKWKAIIMKSHRLKTRLAHDPLPGPERKTRIRQFIDRVKKTKKKEPIHRIRQIFSKSGEYHHGSILMLQDYEIDMALAFWHSPQFVLPSDTIPCFMPGFPFGIVCWVYDHPNDCTCSICSSAWCKHNRYV